MKTITFTAVTKHNFENGVIKGVSLMTAGEEAKGHGVWFDDNTLVTALASLKGKKTLKAYVTHYREEEDSMLISGYFTNIRIEGNKLLADFKFLEAFKKYNPEQYDTLVELINDCPDAFGISAEANGDIEEVYTLPLPAFRVTDFYAAAFVSDPAVNSGGLFGIGKSKFSKILTKIKTMTPQTNIIKELKNKFTDKKQLARAYSVIAESNEDLTVEQVEQVLATQDTAAIIAEKDAEIARLNGVVSTLQGQIEEIKKQAPAVPVIDPNAPVVDAPELVDCKKELAEAKKTLKLFKAKFGEAVDDLGENTPGGVSSLTFEQHYDVFCRMPYGKNRTEYFDRFLKAEHTKRSKIK